MDHTEFFIGAEFTSGDRRWRCTDIGRRTIVAIQINAVHAVTIPPNGHKIVRRLNQADADAEGWFNGPPYAVVEHVFDECDLDGCEPG